MVNPGGIDIDRLVMLLTITQTIPSPVPTAEAAVLSTSIWVIFVLGIPIKAAFPWYSHVQIGLGEDCEALKRERVEGGFEILHV